MPKKTKIELPDGDIDFSTLLEQMGLLTIDRVVALTGKSEHTIKYHIRKHRESGVGLLKGRYVNVTPKIKIWVCAAPDVNEYAKTNTRSREHLKKTS